MVHFVGYLDTQAQFQKNTLWSLKNTGEVKENEEIVAEQAKQNQLEICFGSFLKNINIIGGIFPRKQEWRERSGEERKESN